MNIEYSSVYNFAAENRDVYSHMKQLWLNNCSAKLKENFDQLSVKQALGESKQLRFKSCHVKPPKNDYVGAVCDWLY